MIYNFYFDMASLLIVAVIFIYHKYQYSNQTLFNKIFSILALTAFASTLLDILSGYTISYWDKFPLFLNKILSMLYFSSCGVLGYLFAYYVEITVNERINKIFSKVNIAILTIFILLNVANIWTGMFFKFSETVGYSHGGYFMLEIILPSYYVLYSAIIILLNVKRMMFEKIVSTGSYVVIIIISLVYQTFVDQKLLLTGFAYAMTLLIIFLMLETPDYQKLQMTMLELENARKDADKANAAKSSFLANMSHEIRTPINAVIGMNEMIIKETKEISTREYAENAKSAGNTLLSLVNSILDFSKIESGKFEIVNVEYDTAVLFNNVVNMLEIKAKQKKLDFIVEIDNELPSKLKGDDLRVRQIILNILNNAVKYTRKGSVKMSVSCEKCDNNMIALKIVSEDTGIGIKDEDREKLFKEFQRIDEKRNNNIEGTGLGLAITKRIVDEMGGTISFDSEYGKGTVFTVIINQEVVDWSAIGDFNSRHFEDVKNKEVSPKVMTAPNAKILVVDDNEMNIMVAKNYLKNLGAKIDYAYGGQECIDYVKNESYDIVFLDHMMPEIDGIDTIKAIRSSEYSGNARVVIALTANAILGARELYLDNGFNDYLSKPVLQEDFEKTIKKYLPHDMIKYINSEKYIQTEIGLGYCGNNNDLYQKMLEVFAKSYDEKVKLIKNYYDNKEWKDYEIQVHAMKSSTLSIGAKSLSEKFLELEMTSKKLMKDETIDWDVFGKCHIDALEALAIAVNEAESLSK